MSIRDSGVCFKVVLYSFHTTITKSRVHLTDATGRVGLSKQRRLRDARKFGGVVEIMVPICFLVSLRRGRGDYNPLQHQTC